MFSLIDADDATNMGIVRVDFKFKVACHFLPLTQEIYDLFMATQFDANGHLTKWLRVDGKPFSECLLRIVDQQPMLVINCKKPWALDDKIGWRISGVSEPTIHLWNLTLFEIDPAMFGEVVEFVEQGNDIEAEIMAVLTQPICDQRLTFDILKEAVAKRTY